MFFFNEYQKNLHDRDWASNHYLSARSLSEANNVRSQLLGIMERLGIDVVTKTYRDQTRHYQNIRKALVCGYFMQVAHKVGVRGPYRTIKDDQDVLVHPSCSLGTRPQSEWVLFNEFVLTTRAYIRTVTEIRVEWLLDFAPDYYDLATFPNGEAKRALQRAQNLEHMFGRLRV